MKTFQHLFAALFLAVLSGTGCASIGARQDQNVAQLYPGVRDDAYYLFHPSQADHAALQWLNLLDLPFSAVADTFMIQVDLSGDPIGGCPSYNQEHLLAHGE